LLIAAGLWGVLLYMVVSRTGARLRNAFPSHLTRVRTIRIGLPQHVQFTTNELKGSKPFTE